MTLAEALRRLKTASKSRRSPAVDPRPACAGGLVTRERVDDLSEDLVRLESKINALLGGVALALLLDLLRGIAS